jgi:hypothetical protein
VTFHDLLAAFDSFLDSGRWLRVLLFVLGLCILRVAVRLQRSRDNHVDFSLLLLDQNGRTSGPRVFQTGCFVASTWAFIVLANAGQLQEWYFLGYIALWSGTAEGAAFLRMRFGKDGQPAPTTVTATVQAGDTVTVGTAPPAPSIPPVPPPSVPSPT